MHDKIKQIPVIQPTNLNLNNISADFPVNHSYKEIETISLEESSEKFFFKIVKGFSNAVNEFQTKIFEQIEQDGYTPLKTFSQQGDIYILAMKPDNSGVSRIYRLSDDQIIEVNLSKELGRIQHIVFQNGKYYISTQSDGNSGTTYVYDEFGNYIGNVDTRKSIFISDSEYRDFKCDKIFEDGYKAHDVVKINNNYVITTLNMDGTQSEKVYIYDQNKKLINDFNLGNISVNSIENIIQIGDKCYLETTDGKKYVYDEASKKLINEKNFIKADTIKTYEEFNNDSMDSGYKAQGITEIDGKYFISAYKDGAKSKIYIYDKSGNYQGQIILENESHVGGMSYSEELGVMFVAGDEGTVTAYNYELINDAINIQQENPNKPFKIDFNKGNNGEFKIKNDQNVMESTKEGKTSTLYYYDGQLYAATFVGNGKGEMVTLDIDYDEKTNNITYTQSTKTTIPEQTQGIAITEYNNKKYLIVSQSYSKYLDSNVLLYELNDSGEMTYKGKYYSSVEGLEGVKVNSDGSVIFVSEFDDKLEVTTMEEIIKNVSNKEHYGNEYLSSLVGEWYDF